VDRESDTHLAGRIENAEVSPVTPSVGCVEGEEVIDAWKCDELFEELQEHVPVELFLIQLLHHGDEILDVEVRDRPALPDRLVVRAAIYHERQH
jgi:hypothetical protein